MDFSKFFIDRPIFAAVLSIVIFAAGLIAIPLLPIGEYPEVVPPSVVVRTVYPGANPKVIAETVATPLEESIRGVEGLMYMKSVASSDGVLTTTVTFNPDTDADEAAVRVQNRVSQALARLPEGRAPAGRDTQKQSPVFLMWCIWCRLPASTNACTCATTSACHIRTGSPASPAWRRAAAFGGGDYAMRLGWIPTDRRTRHDRRRRGARVREQNIQVSAGQLGAEPMPNGSDFLPRSSMHAAGWKPPRSR